MKAVNIKWDTDDTDYIDDEPIDLPSEMEIPEGVDVEDVGDWISDQTGFCHYGFEIKKVITKESVENDLYDFFNDKMETGDAPEIEGVLRQYDPANGKIITINCVGGKQIRLIIQVD